MEFKWCSQFLMLNQNIFENFGLSSTPQWVKGSVNPEVVKFIDCGNFLTITITYTRIYIFGREMSYRIYIWYQISSKMQIF